MLSICLIHSIYSCIFNYFVSYSVFVPSVSSIFRIEFYYHSVITNGCQDTLPATAFLYRSLFFSDLFIFSTQQKNPRNTRFLGYLTFGHNVPYGTQYLFAVLPSNLHCSLLIEYYSMIVATRLLISQLVLFWIFLVMFYFIKWYFL